MAGEAYGNDSGSRTNFNGTTPWTFSGSSVRGEFGEPQDGLFSGAAGQANNFPIRETRSWIGAINVAGRGDAEALKYTF